MPPNNGNVNVSSMEVGGIAEYNCDLSYTLSDPEAATRMCLENGSWSGSEPVCECKCIPITTFSSSASAMHAANVGWGDPSHKRVCPRASGLH